MFHTFITISFNTNMESYLEKLEKENLATMDIPQGCESSDFNLISDLLALHKTKTPFSDY